MFRISRNADWEDHSVAIGKPIIEVTHPANSNLRAIGADHLRSGLSDHLLNEMFFPNISPSHVTHDVNKRNPGWLSFEPYRMRANDTTIWLERVMMPEEP